MTRYSYVRASLLASIAFVTPAMAADTTDMINQLLPAQTRAPATVADAPVFSVQSATKDEIVGRLGSDLLARSVDPKTPRATSIVLGEGHEAQTLAALKLLPSIQVAVAFQGSSDALAPESGPLLGTLAQALNDPKLASYRFAVGVHTSAVGSDDYNLSLSNLRAKAIVATLVAVHGIDKGRLFAAGFGRMVDGSTDATQPSERIRVVNLGDTTVVPASPAAGAAPALLPPKPALAATGRGHPVLHAKRATTVHVARHRTPITHLAAVSVPHPIRHVRHPVHLVGESPRHRPVPAHYLPSEEAPEPVTNTASGFEPMPSFDRRSTNGGSGNGGSSGGGSSAGGSSGGGSGGSSGGGHGWSDRRLKRDIKRIGTSPSGLGLYSFRYVWGGPVMVGVMAQDLLDTHPEAVLVGPGGYMQVDYAAIDVTMMTLKRWRSTKGIAASF